MSASPFFSVGRYDNASVLTWSERAASRVFINGELPVALHAFAHTAKPSRVVVRFSRLTLCPTALVGGLLELIQHMKQRGGRLMLCEMNPLTREQLDRLNLNRVFEIHGSLSGAVMACEEARESGGEHGQAKTKD